MPKLDHEAIPQSNGTGYPDPGRQWRRLAPAGGLTQMGPPKARDAHLRTKAPSRVTERPERRIYDEAAWIPQIILREASDRLCGE
ncbi:hypothetical protein GCM10011494_32630 [Novosphingobium endophyticum]|uniref:Uncharacterized protein n=1 Tax=Novosphingobium endophyticum TaxID=1955250 RepID=A0A916TXA6_9SPHN|nr:hypothetical protein GCM10011494_32630 [Novosphingobium endophyticum]